ncbi:hypothetical protein [Pallidibacillus pasinlerensis]|uniref:DUF4868 domain-containing protein n=1 Tax=Pallidibacillus pasinlerensis TaxID=2703818 RepID=A0ABX0A500_9BACI|nr:hypothetical protein [Pallidibacillus pasinlerensis]NCU18523.1 hypothetical protein [Pallidibacillus pasinlerensis]
MTAILDENNIFMFIKFAREEKYLEDLQKGNLYMNNGRYFIEREKQDGEKGIGDKYEMSAVINNVNLKFYNSETNEFLFEGEAERIAFNYNHVLTKPIFCITHISADSLKIIKEHENSVDCQFNFSSEDIEQIVKEFGEYALLINPRAFQERVENTLKDMGITYLAGKIVYEDFNINSSKRLEEYQKNHPAIFFKKDKSFEHQKEYRIVLTGIDSNEPYILKIGDISDISYLMLTKDLFSGKFALNLSK